MITYGNGEVLFDGSSNGFQFKYKGTITITDSPDNLFISANNNKIVGVMLDGSGLPNKLFSYVGELRLALCKTVQDNKMQREKVTLHCVCHLSLQLHLHECE